MAQVSLARKKELMEPDEVEVFLKKGVERALQNKNYILIGLVVFFTGVIVVSGLFYHFRNREMKASLELRQIISQYDNGGESEADSSEVLSRFKTFFDLYSGTRSAQFAGLRYGNLCYQEKQYDEAINYYKKALKQFSNNSALTTMIRFNLGHAYLAKKEYETAKTYFEQVADAKGSIFKEEALFNLGLIYDVMGDKAKRDERFGQIGSLEKSAIYADLVKEKIGK